MLQEIFYDSLKISKFTRVYMEKDSLASLVRRLLLFDMNWNRTLCRELFYLMKSQ